LQQPQGGFSPYTANISEIDRDSGKTFNFAKIYGAGIKLLATQLGKSLEETERLLARYDAAMPFINQLDAGAKIKLPIVATSKSTAAHGATSPSLRPMANGAKAPGHAI
jgi:hypothetical protein